MKPSISSFSVAQLLSSHPSFSSKQQPQKFPSAVYVLLLLCCPLFLSSVARVQSDCPHYTWHSLLLSGQNDPIFTFKVILVTWAAILQLAFCLCQKFCCFQFVIALLINATTFCHQLPFANSINSFCFFLVSFFFSPKTTKYNRVSCAPIKHENNRSKCLLNSITLFYLNIMSRNNKNNSIFIELSSIST